MSFDVLLYDVLLLVTWQGRSARVGGHSANNRVWAFLE